MQRIAKNKNLKSYVLGLVLILSSTALLNAKPKVTALPIDRILREGRQKDLEAPPSSSSRSLKEATPMLRTTRTYVMTPNGLAIAHESVPGMGNVMKDVKIFEGRDLQEVIDENDGTDNSGFDEVGEFLTPQLLSTFRMCTGSRIEQGINDLNNYWMAAMSSIAYMKYPIGYQRLSEMGFDEIAFTESADDIEVFIAKRSPKKDAAGNPIPGSGLSVVAFRGTDSARDWLTDLQTRSSDISNHEGEAWLHEGFALALNGVYKEVLRILDVEHNDNPIFLTGHSLGGALAMQMAIRMVSSANGTEPPVIKPTDDRLRGIYVYAVPRVGNDKARAIIDRYMNATRNIAVSFQINQDPVTKVPFHWQGYRRFGLNVVLPSMAYDGFGDRTKWSCYTDVTYKGPDFMSWDFLEQNPDLHYMRSYARHIVPFRQDGRLNLETCADATPLWGSRFKVDGDNSYQTLKVPGSIGRNPCDYTAYTWDGRVE